VSGKKFENNLKGSDPPMVGSRTITPHAISGRCQNAEPSQRPPAYVAATLPCGESGFAGSMVEGPLAHLKVIEMQQSMAGTHRAKLLSVNQPDQK
jgi:hypothetical protein